MVIHKVLQLAQEFADCDIIGGVTQRNAANLLRLSPPPKRTYIYKIANLSGLARSTETTKLHILNEHVLLGGALRHTPVPGVSLCIRVVRIGLGRPQ